MTPIKIGIVEDDLIVGKSIFALLKKIGYQPIPAVRSYKAALQMIQRDLPDLLLLDIELDGNEDGIELAEVINNEYGIPFIFLTGNSTSEFIERAKKVNPSAYLLKPFKEADLFTSIEIAFGNFNDSKKSSQRENQQPPANRDYIFIKEDDTFQKLKLTDILYVESDHVYLNIHTLNKSYVVRTKLEDFMNENPAASLIRVHRSFAVSLIHLEEMDAVSVRVGEKSIPLGQAYKQDLLNNFNRFV